MKKYVRCGLMLAASMFLTLGAADLIDCAPKQSSVVAFINLKKILDSRCMQEFGAEDPEFAEKKAIFNAEVCFFSDARDLEHGCAFQVLVDTGNADRLFEECAKFFAHPENVEEKEEMRILRENDRVLIRRNAQLLQFSCGQEPMMLVKGDSPLVKELDRNAMLGIAVDLEKFRMPDDLQKDETFREMCKGVEKMTFHLAEKGDVLILTSVGIYRDETSAKKAKKVADILSEMMKKALDDPSRQNDRASLLMRRLSVKDETKLDGVRLIGTTVIDRALAHELRKAFQQK